MEAGWEGSFIAFATRALHAPPTSHKKSEETGRRPVRSPLRSLHLGPLAPLASVNRPPRYPTSLVS